MKVFKNSGEEISGNTIIAKKNCEFCGKPVKMYRGKYDRPYKFVFINIAQDPPKHYFCSKKCKNKWIFKPDKRKIFNIEQPKIPNS